MKPFEFDPHGRFLRGTKPAFEHLLHGECDGVARRLMRMIRRRVMQGGFPINPDIQQENIDAIVATVPVPERFLPAFGGEGEEDRSMRQAIQKLVIANPDGLLPGRADESAVKTKVEYPHDRPQTGPQDVIGRSRAGW